MKFFVPDTDKEEFETIYKRFADAAGVEVPVLADRVYSIEFSSNGETWNATIGEQLKGTKKLQKTNGDTEKISDGAKVLAIFRSSPYVVLTNKDIDPNVRSNWVNPFFAGMPTKVVNFS